MDLAKVLVELRRELADLDAAIASLEQLPQARPRRGHASKEQALTSRDEEASMPATVQATGSSRDSA
ncbi:MAG: hypothetical protein ABSH42_02090 [Bryobacteraceae bacterium]|jgi:hypothetical protein